jgi:hypothetical protein
MKCIRAAALPVLCSLMASCSQSKSPAVEQPLPLQDKMQALCDVNRIDLYNMAEQVATAKSDKEYSTGLKLAEDADKIMSMLNCKRWAPS